MKKILAIAFFLMITSSAFADINKANIFGISLDEGSVILMGDAAPDFVDYSKDNECIQQDCRPSKSII